MFGKWINLTKLTNTVRKRISLYHWKQLLWSNYDRKEPSKIIIKPIIVRKEFSLVRLTGHDFLQVGTGGTDTTNWPNNPTQDPNQTYQVMTNETDPGRVYYTATDDLGNFYVGDQFKVDQATGNVTLDASAFNLSGLESLRLGSVGGLIGASINEFST